MEPTVIEKVFLSDRKNSQMGLLLPMPFVGVVSCRVRRFDAPFYYSFTPSKFPKVTITDLA